MDPVLAAAAELALSGGTRMVEPGVLEAACAGRGLDHERCFTALVALRDAGMLQLAASPTTQVVLVALTDGGVLRYAETARPDMQDVRERIGSAAAGAVGQGAVDLAAEVGEPPLLVECILDQWVREGQVVYSRATGRRFRIHRFRSSPDNRAR